MTDFAVEVKYHLAKGYLPEQGEEFFLLEDYYSI